MIMHAYTTPQQPCRMRWLRRWFLCQVLGAHAWTSAVFEGIDPTRLQLSGGVRGFKDYAKTYCKRCGMISPLSQEWQQHGNL